MKSWFIRYSFSWCALLAIGGTCLAQAEPPRQLSPSQKIYLFQHRLIPEWTHRSNGAFFEDLSSGQHQRLLDLAAEVVSPEFAGGISIQAYPKADGLLIAFPAPVEPPQCYFIYIRRDPAKRTFSLFTYEKTPDLFGKGHKGGVVGSWSAGGQHGNLGPRDYEDAASFVKDVQGPTER